MNALADIQSMVMDFLVSLPQQALATSELLGCLPALGLLMRTIWHTREDDEGLRHRTRWIMPTALVILLVEGYVACDFRVSTTLLLSLDILALMPVLCRLCDMDIWRILFLSASASYLVAGVSFPALLIDGALVGNSLSTRYFAWPGMLAQWTLWAMTVGSLWHLTGDTLPRFMRSPYVSQRFWRNLWIIPSLLAIVLEYSRPNITGTYPIEAFETAAILFVALVGLTTLMSRQLQLMVRATGRRIEAERELAHATLQGKRLEYLEDRIRNDRRARHDIRHRLIVLRTLTNEGDIEGLSRYLDGLANMVTEDSPILYTDKHLLNACLVYYTDTAKREGAQTDVEVRIAQDLVQDQRMVLSVVTNLLENAVTGIHDYRLAREEQDKKPFLRVRIAQRGQSLFIIVDNFCAPELTMRRGGSFVSTKATGTGLGIPSIQKAARDTGGLAQFELEGETFRASVMLGGEPAK